MKEIVLADFQGEVLQAQTPVLVDVYTDYCNPCRDLIPVLEQIAAARASNLRIVKVNAVSERALASQLAVRTVPTLILFRDGQALGQRCGAVSRADLDRWLDENL